MDVFLDLGFGIKVVDVFQLAVGELADCWERRPDEVLDAGGFGGVRDVLALVNFVAGIGALPVCFILDLVL
jgi:hypothetical protein